MMSAAMMCIILCSMSLRATFGEVIMQSALEITYKTDKTAEQMAKLNNAQTRLLTGVQ